MKDPNKYSADYELLEKQIYLVFDFFRNNGIAITERYSFLFLLYLYNENLLTDDFPYSGKIINLTDVSNSTIEEKDKILEIAQFFGSELILLDNFSGVKKIKTLTEAISIFDKELLSKHFVFVFEFMLYANSISNGKFEDVFIQPTELTKFISAFIGSVDGLNVYNPFAGGASFIKDFSAAKYIFAQEINRKVWAIGQLRLLVHKVNGEFRSENVFENWPAQNQKFDLIISNPPFNSMKDRAIRGRLINKYSSAEQFIIERGLDLLTPKGKIMLIVPFGFLTSKNGSEQIVKNLIEQDLIDTIVNFPSGILHNTGLKISAILINKEKEIPNQIKFVDASFFVEEKNKFQKSINVIELLTAIDNDDQRAIRNINKTVIEENQNDLNFQRYFTNLDDFRNEKNSKLISLNEILKSVNKPRENSTYGKFIKIADLSNDKFNFNVDIDSLKESEIDRSFYQLNEPAILIAKTFNRLKPSYCDASIEKTVFVSQNIEAFILISNDIELPYLIMQLNSDFVQTQLEINSNGVVYPNLKIADILNLKIEIPNLNKQESRIRQIALIEGAKLQSDRDNIEKLQLQNTINTLVQERVNDFQWALHDIRNGDLLAITNKASIMSKLSNIDNKMQEIVIDDKKGITLKTLVVALNENVKRLAQSLTEMYETTERFGEQEKINIIEFIESFISSQDILDKQKFVYENVEMETLFDEQNVNGKSIYIDFNKIDLKQIFVNIFENIRRHAGFFENKNLTDNKIKILILLNNNELNISVLNTGISNKINQRDYFAIGGRFGKNANTGKGGHIIKTRAERNNSEVFQNTYDENDARGYVFEVGFKTKYYLNEQ